MKICYDVTDELKLTKNGNFSIKKNNKTIIYYYHDSCKICNEPFLSLKKSALYCDNSCCSKDEKWKISVKNNNKFNGLYGDSNPNWKGGISKNETLFGTYNEKLNWCEPTRRSPNNEKILEVKCVKCSKWFIPTRSQVSNRIQSINGNYNHENKFYCSEACKNNCTIYRKSPYSIQRNDEMNAGHFDMNAFALYKRKCYAYSRKVYHKFKDAINPLNLPLGKNKNHIDHKVSLYDGFINNIPIYIICSVYNLQLLSERDNIVKGKKSDISVKELQLGYININSDESFNKY